MFFLRCPLGWQVVVVLQHTHDVPCPIRSASWRWLGPLWCRCCSSALVCQARHESPLNHTTVAVCFKHSQPTTTTSSLLKCVKRRLQLVLWYFLHNNCLAKINQHLLNFHLLKVKILTTKVRVYIIVGNESDQLKTFELTSYPINVIFLLCYLP